MPTITIPKEYMGTVLQKTPLYKNTVHLVVKPSAIPPYKAGQYASFILATTRRLFSFVTTPQEENLEFVIGYKPDGPTISFIENLAVGNTFSFMAPYGQFVVEESDNRPLLFIAGGTGIAPIISQIKQALSNNPSSAITLYFASYDADRLYLRSLLEELAQKHPSFSFRPCLSEPTKPWNGRQGLVTTIIPQEVPKLAEHTIYICGSPGFVMATIAMAKERNVPAEHIHFERFT